MWAFWEATSRLGLRPTEWLGLMYRDTVFRFPVRRHPGVRGHVALTIDDGLCRGGRDRALIAEVRELLRKHGATATFMLCSDYVAGFEGEAKLLCEDGHEFGNHCPCDREYASVPPDQFEEQLLQTSRCLETILGEGGGLRWFRAPQAKYTATMREAITKSGLRHALGDAYCDDWAVEDARWVAKTLLRQLDSGSIIIMHMPERGFREHLLEALRLVLEGLSGRGLRAVTLSQLEQLALAPPVGEPEGGRASSEGLTASVG